MIESLLFWGITIAVVGGGGLAALFALSKLTPGQLWSLMFLAVPILGVGLFVVAAAADTEPLVDHWLPKNINDHGYVIDQLYMFILYLTGVIFVGTSLALFYFLWQYDADKNAEPVKFVHGSHSLEVIWSILPAATLLFIAIYQMDAWADAKTRRPDIPPMARVTGRQFEWRMEYAGPDGVIGTFDDIHDVNDLHIPVGEDVVLEIESRDVLHSFFLPNVRVKHDVVPGMRQYVWFRANQTGTYDIVCAELCGWGHYKMRGRLIVESRKDYENWLASRRDAENLTAIAGEEDE